jgi:hypothetical protein
MTNFNSRNKGLVTAFTGLFVLASVFGPFVSVASAAAFNQGSQPFDLFAVANATRNPNCNSCWTSSTVAAKVGETVAMRVFFNNTSDETAFNTKVRVTTNVSSGGGTITTIGRVWADNASAQSDGATIDIEDSDASHLTFLSTKVYDWNGNQVGFSGSDSNVLNSSGLNVGDIDPGNGNAGFVVVNFRVEGDSNGGSDELDVTTLSATNIDEDSARLRCDVETGDEDAQVWFEWGEDNDDLDEETNNVDVNANDHETVTRVISGLDSDTRYFFRCVAEDDDGNDDEGSIRSFRTDDDGSRSESDAPDVVTLSPTGVDSGGATLHGEVDPNGEDTDAWFEWGTSRTNLNRSTSHQDVGDSTSDVSYSARISGLSANTTYYYRAVAENDEGDDEGNIVSFRTTTPIVNIITRFIDVVREVEVEPEPEVEALIITLNANAVNVADRVIDYTVSYDNRTDLYLTDVVLTVDLPNELEFVDSSPNPSRDLGDQLIYNIGRVEAGERGSFLIETELDSNVDENDVIRFVATVEYNDDGSARKVVEVIDESTFGELSGRVAGSFTAAMIDAFRGLFTNPLLWIILFILLVVFAVRYLLSARERKSDTLV